MLQEAAYQRSFYRLDVLQLAAVAQIFLLDSADHEAQGGLYNETFWTSEYSGMCPDVFLSGKLAKGKRM